MELKNEALLHVLFHTHLLHVATQMQSCVFWQKNVSICAFLKTVAGFLLSFQGRNEIESCEKTKVGCVHQFVFLLGSI